MDGSKVVSDLMRDDLPLAASCCRHACTARRLTTLARRGGPAELAEPSDADFAAGLAGRKQMPQSCAVVRALVATPLREDTEARVEVDADAAASPAG